MAELKFELDNVEVDNPINWEAVTIRYQRDDQINGLFTVYSSEIEFINDGYDAIQTARATGVCESIDAEIFYRCSRFSAWSSLIFGTIRVSECRFDELKCIAYATVELTDCATNFLAEIDRPVDWNAERSINAEIALTSPIQQIRNMFENQSGTSYGVLGYDNAYGAKVGELFEHMTDYLTDGCLNFTSDFLTTAYSPQVITIDFTVAPANGDTVVIRLRSDLSLMEYEASCDIDTGRPNFWEDIRRTLLLIDPASSRGNYWTEPNIVVRSTPGGGVVQRYEITCYHPMSIVSINAGTGTASGSTTTDYVDGMDGMMICSGQSLRDDLRTALGVHELTFRTLFQWVNNIVNIGLSITRSGGTTTLRIEDAKYFYNATSTLVLRGLENLERSFDEAQLADGIILGQEAERYDQYTPPPGNNSFPDNEALFRNEKGKYQTGSTECGTIDRAIPKDCYALMGEKINLVGSGQQLFDDDFFIVFSEEQLGFQFAFDFEFEFYDSNTNTFGEDKLYNKLFWLDVLQHWHKHTLPGANYYYYPAAGLLNYYEELRGFDSATASFTWSQNSLGNYGFTEGDAYAPAIIEFEEFITKDQWDLIVNSQQIGFNQTLDPTNDEDGYIHMIEFNPVTGKATFELRTKE